MEKPPMRRPLLALAFLAACAPAPDAPEATAPQAATFTATDFTFTGPDSLAPGITMFQVVNAGAQDHHLMLAQLDSGKTAQDVIDAFSASSSSVPAWMIWRGGASAVAPHDSTGAVTDLVEGRYVVLCFVPDPADGAPHFMKGMHKEIVVRGPRHEAQPPVADAEIRLSEFAFATPAMTAGTRTFAVVNDGKQVHELQLVRLNEGATVEALMASYAPGAPAGPPPGVSVGGSGAISPGLTNYWTVTLPAGNYVLLCHVPDVDGAPHSVKGMVQAFSIAAE